MPVICRQAGRRGGELDGGPRDVQRFPQTVGRAVQHRRAAGIAIERRGVGIQALYWITQKHAAQNAALRQELTVLSQQNADLALRLAALEESL